MDGYLDRTRYEEFIQHLEGYPAETGKIMLYGSSFFTCWGYERSRDQLKGATGGALDIVNHAFGGAVIDELLYYYPRLVKPYAPRAVVIRSGYNEICGGMNPRDSVFLLQRLVAWLQVDFPGIRVRIVKTFDCKRDDAALYAKMQEYNRILDETFAGEETVKVLDITPFFYEKAADIGDRTKLRDVFVPDGLHLNDIGYAEMADYLGKLLAEDLLSDKNM